jgi:hypothetical protein
MGGFSPSRGSRAGVGMLGAWNLLFKAVTQRVSTSGAILRPTSSPTTGSSDFYTTPITGRTTSTTPEAWSELLALGTVDSIIEKLGQMAAPEINLDEQVLSESQVKKLAAVMEHAQCPPLGLSLRETKAPTFRCVLQAAQRHVPLTRLDLSGLRIHSPTQQGRPCTIPFSYLDEIAILLRPDSKLAELNLGDQILTPTNHPKNPGSKESFMPEETNRREMGQALDAMLNAVRRSGSMKKLRLNDCRLFAVDLKRISSALFAEKEDGIPCGLTELLLARVANADEAALEREAGADDPAAVGAFRDMVKRADGSRTLETLDLGGRETSPPVYIGIETLMAQETAHAERAKRQQEFKAQIQQRKEEVKALRARASQGQLPNEQSVAPGEKKYS